MVSERLKWKRHFQRCLFLETHSRGVFREHSNWMQFGRNFAILGQLALFLSALAALSTRWPHVANESHSRFTAKSRLEKCISKCFLSNWGAFWSKWSAAGIKRSCSNRSNNSRIQELSRCHSMSGARRTTHSVNAAKFHRSTDVVVRWTPSYAGRMHAGRMHTLVCGNVRRCVRH